MFGYSRNSGISWMRDYGDAHHKYQSTDDIRGRVEEPKRPLGQRRSVDMYSIRLKEDGSMGVECVLYKTPVVTFYPTGLVELRNDGWASTSTACFIEEVLGHYASARVFNGSLCVSVGGVEARLDDEVLKIENNRILNPTTDKTHTVIRSEANKVRKQYAEFLKYACALVRLKAEGFTVLEYQEAFGTDAKGGIKDLPLNMDRAYKADFPKDVRSFFALAGDGGVNKHIAHYKAVLAMSWSYGANTYATGYSVTGTHINEAMFKRAFDMLVLGYHRDEVFAIKERELGEVKKDPYKKYFESGWGRLHANNVTSS
jgi:hypothetical protein